MKSEDYPLPIYDYFLPDVAHARFLSASRKTMKEEKADWNILTSMRKSNCTTSSLTRASLR